MPIYKDKSRGTYYVKRRVNGKSTTKRGFRTKHEAYVYEMKLELLEDETISIKLYDLFDLYLDYQHKNTEYGTFQKRKHFINDILKNAISNKQINKISEIDCLHLREQIDNLDYSTNYKNAILDCFKMVLKHGVKYYKLRHDYGILLDPYKKTRDEKIRSRQNEQNIWSVEEFEQFIKCVDNQTYKVFFTLLYFTGMRKGEAQALTWNDIKDHKISIDKSLTKKTENGLYEIKEPKTASSIRQISINESLYNFLMKYKEREKLLAGFNEDWFVFGRMKPLPQTTIDRVKNEAVKKAGVKNIRLHDFRHSHASNLIALGVNPVAVSRRLGHSKIDMTLSTYTHNTEKSELDLTDKLEMCSQNVLTA